MELWQVLVLCLVLGCCCSYGVAQDPIVILRQGTLRGVKMYTETRVPVNAFLGIPYVAPPVGNLRFASPERHRGWNGTMLASSFGAACPQLLPTPSSPSGGLPGVGGAPPGVSTPTDTSEDCLFVNVWTPELGSGGYRGLPVVLLLEGDEGFAGGWPGRFPGQELAAEGFLVVSASYRLNLMGFFSLGRSESRGNLGLLDQYLALLWVRENAGTFGGDPGSVTLLGHGAGAASALLHAASPRTRGLFHRVIAMSGSPLAPWAGGGRRGSVNSVVTASREAARLLSCLSDSPVAMLACLRTKSPGEIMRAFHGIYQGGNWSVLPLPVTDDFLPENDRYLPLEPREALRSVTVPVLLGTVSHDGVAALGSLGELARQGYEPLLRYAERAAVPSITVQAGLLRRAATVRELIHFQYLGRARPGDAEALLQQIIRLYTDSQFRAPALQTATLLAEGVASPPVYLYELGEVEGGSQQGALPGADLLHHSGINVAGGAAHGTDLLLLLGPGLLARALGRRLTPSEDRLAASIKRLFLDYIRQGSPTPGTYGYGAQWRRFAPAEGNVFALENQQSRPRAPPGPGESLWSSLLPRLDSMPPELAEEARNSLAEQELRDGGGGGAYRSTTLALGAVCVVLAALLALSLALLRYRTTRHRDSAEDAF